jgi:hypothetical protein
MSVVRLGAIFTGGIAASTSMVRWIVNRTDLPIRGVAERWAALCVTRPIVCRPARYSCLRHT